MNALPLRFREVDRQAHVGSNTSLGFIMLLDSTLVLKLNSKSREGSAWTFGKLRISIDHSVYRLGNFSISAWLHHV